MVSQLGLSSTQVKQMEDTFRRYRLKLIDLNASLEKEEVTLEPLVSTDTLDEAKLTAQIDRVAQARRVGEVAGKNAGRDPEGSRAGTVAQVEREWALLLQVVLNRTRFMRTLF